MGRMRSQHPEAVPLLRQALRQRRTRDSGGRMKENAVARNAARALGVPGASVAEGIRKMKDAAIAIANDRNGITPCDCSALMSEIGTYFDRAAAAVA